MDDQVNEDTTPASGTGESDTGSVDLAAELERTRKELAKVRDEAAGRRKAKTEAEAKARAEAIARGDLEQAVKAQEERIAELEALREPAERWTEHETAQRNALEARIAALPPGDAELVRAAPSLELQQKMLERLIPPPSPPKLNTSAHSGSDADPPPPKDLASMSREELRALGQSRHEDLKQRGIRRLWG